MTTEKLQPCPYCGKLDYEYGSSLLKFFGETAKALPNLLANGIDPKKILIGIIVSPPSSGMGIFSLPILFYQGVFKDLDGHPLLRCKHCDHAVIACIKCSSFMLLEREPGTAELIECPNCKAKFQHCEQDDDFDRLLNKK